MGGKTITFMQAPPVLLVLLNLMGQSGDEAASRQSCHISLHSTHSAVQ